MDEKEIEAIIVQYQDYGAQMQVGDRFVPWYERAAHAIAEELRKGQVYWTEMTVDIRDGGLIYLVSPLGELGPVGAGWTAVTDGQRVTVTVRREPCDE